MQDKKSGRFCPKYSAIQVGQTYGLWEVLRTGVYVWNQQRWWCRCACGAEKEIASQHLAAGKSTRCIKCAGKKNQERAQKRNVLANGTILYSTATRAKWLQDVRKLLHEKQKGICPICLRPVDVNDCLDHSHKTGFVRALVHRGCNVFIGFIENHDGVIERTLTHLSDGRA
jgi:Recombination endonuclease VII